MQNYCFIRHPQQQLDKQIYVNLLLIRFICMFCYVKKLIRTFYLVLVFFVYYYGLQIMHLILGLVVHLFFAYYIT